MRKWKNTFSWNKIALIIYANGPDCWLKTLPFNLLNFTQRRQGIAIWAEYVIWALQHLSDCLSALAAAAISAAAWRERLKKRGQMPLGKWHLIASASVPRVPSAGRSGRALQCCGKGYVWQLIVLDTDGNRLGKDGLDALGRDCGWCRDGQGERKDP